MINFHEKPSKILAWLNAKGYSGTLADALDKYIRNGSGLTGGTIGDQLMYRLGGTGTLNDRLANMFQTKTGIANYKEAERAFFQNSSLDMFAGGGIDTYTKLMLHMDGTNGSTTFTDSSTAQAAKTVTAQGNAQISTAKSKFGGASGLFDGTGDFLTLPDSADLQFGSGDYTIDFWFNTTTIAIGTQGIYGDLDGGGSNWSIMIDFDHAAAPDNIRANIANTDASYSMPVGPGTLAANTWYHVALVRNGNSLAVAVDGQFGSSVSVTGKTIKSNQNVGSWSIAQLGSYGLPVNGNIDEFRISKGIARWTSNFTPPGNAYS